eukprot:s2967_g1.t1
MDFNDQVPQVVLTSVILTFMARGPGDSAVGRLESVREGIRNILTVTGVRRSMASLCLIWKCITSAKIARDRGQTADNFTFLESPIASAAPNRYCYQLSHLVSQPWVSHFAQELESDVDTLRDLLEAIPPAQLELREWVYDACLVLGDAFDMLERSCALHSAFLRCSVQQFIATDDCWFVGLADNALSVARMKKIEPLLCNVSPAVIFFEASCPAQGWRLRMGKKGKDAAPETVEDPDEEEEREATPEAPPEAASRILKDLDWEVCVMPALNQRYFYSKSRRQARIQPPYHSILGLEETI